MLCLGVGLPPFTCQKVFALGRLQYLEPAHELIIDYHYGSCIVPLSVVVRSREDSDQLSISEELVAIFNDLMSSANQV